MVINGNLFPNEGVHKNCELRRMAGKRNFSFYSCYWFKSRADDENPMPFVENTDLYNSDYAEWKKIVNATCYYNHDDGDVHVGQLTQDWNGHKKGAYVVYHSPALNGHWAAVENNRCVRIYKYDEERNIMTDGQQWFMYFKTAEKGIDDFEKTFRDYQKYGKKPWAPGELRDYGTKVDQKGNTLWFHTDGYTKNCQCTYEIKK